MKFGIEVLYKSCLEGLYFMKIDWAEVNYTSGLKWISTRNFRIFHQSGWKFV